METQLKWHHDPSNRYSLRVVEKDVKWEFNLDYPLVKDATDVLYNGNPEIEGTLYNITSNVTFGYMSLLEAEEIIDVLNMMKKDILMDLFRATAETPTLPEPTVSIAEQLSQEKLYQRNLKLPQRKHIINNAITINGTKLKLYNAESCRIKYTLIQKAPQDALLLNNFKSLTISIGQVDTITLCLLEKTGNIYLDYTKSQEIMDYTCKGNDPIIHVGRYIKVVGIKRIQDELDPKPFLVFFPNNKTDGYVDISFDKDFIAKFGWLRTYVDPVTHHRFVTSTIHKKCLELEALLKATYTTYPYPEMSRNPQDWYDFSEYMAKHPDYTIVTLEEYRRLAVGLTEYYSPKTSIYMLNDHVVIPKHWAEFPGAYALDFTEDSTLYTLMGNVCMHANELRRKLLEINL